MQLFAASQQWATRTVDETFLSLEDMLGFYAGLRQTSRERIMSNRDLQFVPAEGGELKVINRNGAQAGLTNWAMGQLASLAGAEQGYLTKLPPELAADCMNWGLQRLRKVEELGILVSKAPQAQGSALQLRAATGPRYGRIWNEEVLRGLVGRFGDGLPGSGDWTIPGYFGQRPTEVTKENSTLWGGDRDMFVFLADEKNLIEVPGRRQGRASPMSRGFFCWNSEVGARSFGIATFYFDFVCSNRIVWGARDYREITIRHSAGAPHRWIEQALPAIELMQQAGTHDILSSIAQAKKQRLDADSVDVFLAGRFGKGLVEPFKKQALAEEDRPIENTWDVICAATAYARGIQNQDARVALERKAGELMPEAEGRQGVPCL